MGRVMRFGFGVTYGGVMFVCVACGDPAFRYINTVRCLDDDCNIARTLRAIPDVLPWEEWRASR